MNVSQVIAAIALVLTVIFGYGWLSTYTQGNNIREYRTVDGTPCVVTGHAISCNWSK